MPCRLVSCPWKDTTGVQHCKYTTLTGQVMYCQYYYQVDWLSDG